MQCGWEGGREGGREGGPPKQCLSNSTEAPVRVSGEQFRIVSMYSFICQQKQYTQCDVWSCAGSVHFTIVSIARTLIHNGRGREGGREGWRQGVRTLLLGACEERADISSAS